MPDEFTQMARQSIAAGYLRRDGGMNFTLQAGVHVPQLDLFGQAIPTFDQNALGFLIDFARSRNGASFGGEDVVRAANEAGLHPRDLRNWGPVFAQAARQGYIARDYSHTFRRATSNGSLGVGWKYIDPAQKDKALSATN